MKRLLVFFFILFPAICYPAIYSVKECNIDISVKKNAEIYIKEDVTYSFPQKVTEIKRIIPLIAKDLKGKSFRIFLYDIEVLGHKYTIQKGEFYKIILIRSGQEGFLGDVKVRFHYKIYGTIIDLKDFLNLYFTIRAYHYDSSIDRITFFIFLPDNFIAKEEDLLLMLNDREVSKELLNVSIDRGYIYGKVEKPIPKDGVIDFYLNLPVGLIKPGRLTEIELYLKEKKVYLIPLFVFLTAFIIWWFFGKDETTARVIHYKPPKDLNPAIAGYLFNDRADNRDLISLIFYWAKEGIISIEEVDDPLSIIFKSKDYIIKREKLLPLSAKPFEWIIFNGLFPYNVKVIRLSSLKDNFYQVMEQARKELENYIHSMDLYRKGSREIGKVFKYLSLAVFSMAVGFLFFKQWDWGISLSFSSAVLFLFSLIMPKKSSYGKNMYEILIGFKDFLEKVERPRIEKMISKNPEYFNEILPYAIALGVADKISKKFDGLFSKPPDWLSTASKDRSLFNFPLIVDMVIDDFFKLFLTISTSK